MVKSNFSVTKFFFTFSNTPLLQKIPKPGNITTGNTHKKLLAINTIDVIFFIIF